MAEFKDRLKQLRKERGLTQKELAEELNCSDVAVMRYEKGQREPKFGSEMSIKQWEGNYRTPRMNSLIGLAQFFEVSTDYLLGLSDKRVNQPLFELSTEELLLELLRRERN